MNEQPNLNKPEIEKLDLKEKELEEFVQGIFEKLDAMLPSPIKEGSGEEIVSEEIHRNAGLQIVGKPEVKKDRIIFIVRTPDGRYFERTWPLGTNEKRGEFKNKELKDFTPPTQ